MRSNDESIKYTMKISIPIRRDSENSYPSEHVEFYLSDEFTTIKVSDEEREMTVNTQDLRRLLCTILG